jgi:tripartite-type tricarboxylate transporter receptor subunit TctC
MRRRTAMAGIGLAAALLAQGSARAQAGGTRPIKLVVPFAAGTSTDIVGRVLAEALGRQLAQSVIVDNKPGAGGAIGSELVARSGPEGQTLLLGTVGTHAINASLYKRLSYQPQRDFVPLGFLGATPTLLVVPAGAPVEERGGPAAGRCQGGELRLGRQRHLGPPGRRDAQPAARRDASCTCPTRKGPRP